MKNFFFLLVFFIIATSYASSQSWKELLDSTKFYQNKQDLQTTVKWEKLAKQEGEKHNTNSYNDFLKFQAILKNKGLIYAKTTKLHFKNKLNINIDIDSAIINGEQASNLYILLYDEYWNHMEDAHRVVEIFYNYYIESISKDEHIFKEDHFDDLSELFKINVCYLNEPLEGSSIFERYIREELILKEANNLMRNFSPNNNYLAKTLNNLAFYYFNHKDFQKAKPLFLEVLNMERRSIKIEKVDLAICINDVAFLYRSIDSLEIAEKLFTESLLILRNISKNNEPYLSSSINNLAMLNFQINHFNKAENLFKEALEMRKSFIKKNLNEFNIESICYSYFDLGMYYYNVGKRELTEELFKEAINIIPFEYQGNKFWYNVANFYYKSGKIDISLNLFNDLLNKMKMENINNDHQIYSETMNDLAVIFESQGNYRKAEYLYSKALKIKRKIAEKPRDFYGLITSISNLGTFYSKIGNFKTATVLLNEALELGKKYYGSSWHNHKLAVIINNLATLYFQIEKNDAAESLFKEELDILRNVYKNDSYWNKIDLALSISNIACFYLKNNQITKAESLFKEALQIVNDYRYKNDPLIASIFSHYADFNKSVGNFELAKKFYIEALEIRESIYNDINPDIAISLLKLGDLNFEQGDISNAELLSSQGLELQYKILMNYFSSLSENEKELIWSTVKDNYEKFISYGIKRIDEGAMITQNFYNNILLTKGLLLRSTQKVKKNILNSENFELVKKYEAWQYQKEQISKYSAMTNQILKQKAINLDSIIKNANDKEKELSSLSEEFANTYTNKKYFWENVRNSLKSDESALEIIRFRLFNNKFTDTVFYAALIIKNDAKYPELVVLKNGNELENKYLQIYKAELQNDNDNKESYNFYWSEIAQKLKGIKRVFLSPDGVYNKINLSTLKNPKTKKYLDDEIDISIVTSTRDIVNKNKTQQLAKNNIFELFGDPDFENSNQLIASAASDKNIELVDKFKMESTLDSSTRGGLKLNPLPRTRDELNEISNILKNSSNEFKIYLGTDASEEAVKAVRNPKVLHLASHGYFLNDLEKAKTDLNSMNFGNDQSRITENPLLRSMLFFSGAKKSIDGYANQNYEENNREDGILTAYEAQNLNLDNTELVVLAACETGLGEIKNGEGVYGLQRAFIQAGAKTIIMSLWNANDKATKELMVTFYKEWLSGKTKREAFKIAKKKTRENFRYPIFWGAFVMVGE